MARKNYYNNYSKAKFKRRLLMNLRKNNLQNDTASASPVENTINEDHQEINKYPNMVEIKSVKVDNWGVFFLQKLQNFFNKTDYCDLTLQFQDNSQLKVHRLVLSACTDYFNLLEQQCEVTDDILIMPRDLQADVVVPIVNFMYTGTLEFEVNMYGRLLKTARDMNMTVLLKLLEAHKRTVEVPKQHQQPILLNKGAGQRMNTYARNQSHSGPTTSGGPLQRTYTPRKVAANVATNKPKLEKNVLIRSPTTTSSPFIRKHLPEPVQLVTKYANTSATAQKGPSRFDCSDELIVPEHLESSFDNISYESRPLITARQIIKEEKGMDDDEPSTSASFEKLRKSYTGSIKRPMSPSYSASPPEKKPNLQDIIEYTEADRMRKEIVAEEFEGTEYIEENFSNDEEGAGGEQYQSGKSKNPKSPMVIKNESGSVNHAKIISEVLKKYPHLVKNNKNIKLKIMQKGNTTQTSIVPTSPVRSAPSVTAVTKSAPATKPSTSSIAPTTTPSASSAPKKIDSKTMHALIAKGAENMTGPWLCLKCGVNGRPISIPSYKSFRRHLTNVHKEKIDPKICEHCGLRSPRKEELYLHILVKHNIKPPSEYVFPKCTECKFIAADNTALNKHREENHPKAKINTHHCIYCNKTFSNEILVYAHMRNNHKERACEDGVMDFDEDDGMEDDNAYLPQSQELNTSGDNKIKIISNITLPSKGLPYVIDAGAHTVSAIGGNLSQNTITLEPSSEAEGLSTVASGIATSLAVLDANVEMIENQEFPEGSSEGNATALSSDYIDSAMASVHGEFMKKGNDQEIARFVTEEGSALELTPSQKANLLQQLQDQHGVVMILNDDAGFPTSQAVLSGNQDDSQNIVVVYSQANDVDKEPAASIVTSTATNKTDSIVESTKAIQKSSESSKKSPETEDMDLELENPEDMLIKMEHPEDAETAALIKEKQTEGKETSTKSLISSLEGDWSEDEITDIVEKVKPPKESKTEIVKEEKIEETKTRKSDRKTRSSAESSREKSKSPKGEAEISDEKKKEPSKKSRKGSKDRVVSEKSDKDSKDDKERTVEEEKSKSATTTSDLKKKDDSVKGSKPSSERNEKQTKSSSEKKSTKSDLKTLINDWGDDDEDDEDLDEEEEDADEDENL